METITTEAASNQQGMSRRGFISGAALGTVALLGLAGCAQPNQASTQKESEPSNQSAQAPATPDNISE
ncbi:MAG: twin-arginine translocation signal domain-containing protein, partial [Adlercreutzia equolifaciens]